MEYVGDILAGLGALLIGIAKLIEVTKSNKKKRK
ncbi:Uncharacterised protein [Arcanobacterium haemolyticum]|nr:Uncharacterised protein [Arcanobacterium haemolyticum]